MKALIQSVKSLFQKRAQFVQNNFIKFTAPAKSSQIKGTILDLTRSKAALIAENALLRQQLLVLNRLLNVNKKSRGTAITFAY
jgi:putative transposase